MGIAIYIFVFNNTKCCYAFSGYFIIWVMLFLSNVCIYIFHSFHMDYQANSTSLNSNLYMVNVHQQLYWYMNHGSMHINLKQNSNRLPQIQYNLLEGEAHQSKWLSTSLALVMIWQYNIGWGIQNGHFFAKTLWRSKSFFIVTMWSLTHWLKQRNFWLAKTLVGHMQYNCDLTINAFFYSHTTKRN